VSAKALEAITMMRDILRRVLRLQERAATRLPFAGHFLAMLG
jgi:hypothetical protein